MTNDALAENSCSHRARCGTRIGVVSTYPPAQCGIATYAAALVKALRRSGSVVDVVRIDDGDCTVGPFGVTVAHLVNGSSRSMKGAVAALSRADVVIIQHEYGIYGGADGEEVIALMAGLHAPSIVTLHTVPLVPTPHQRSLLESMAELAYRLVVMSEAAHTRLIRLYRIDPSKVVTIPHGASAPDESAADVDPSPNRPQLLTWGLLGPGKGIEHVIDALAMLSDMSVRPHYTVAGVTHPKVLAQFGDRYRQSLIQRCVDVGVSDLVRFDDTYRSVDQLMRFVASSVVVVLPYDSRDQVTSGVLVDAIAAGRPVIATAFPHAVELLATGAGIVVPHGDTEALADAIRRVTSDHHLVAEMAAQARQLAPSLSWSTIAEQYLDVCAGVSDGARAVAI
jgi:glycosyltransferase involved in cell wall biosynthesis